MGNLFEAHVLLIIGVNRPLSGSIGDVVVRLYSSWLFLLF